MSSLEALADEIKQECYSIREELGQFSAPAPRKGIGHKKLTLLANMQRNKDAAMVRTIEHRKKAMQS